MPLHIDTVRRASARYRARMAKSLYEASREGLPTVFLCHSHLDESLVQGLIVLIEEHGWKVYVDWKDASMPETPSQETAKRIKTKIVELTFFLFLATPNSTSSKWCPWEIGYADGKKADDQILVFPTTDGITTYGIEYLQLYRHIDLSTLGKLGVWRPGEVNKGLLLENLRG